MKVYVCMLDHRYYGYDEPCAVFASEDQAREWEETMQYADPGFVNPTYFEMEVIGD